MAVFNRSKVLGNQCVDWTLMQNGPVNMYWSPKVLSEDCHLLLQAGYLIHSFDCNTWTSHLDVLLAFGIELNFPDYYGENDSALTDCLLDLDIPKVGGMAIVLRGYDSYASQDYQSALCILDILANTSRHFLLFGEHFVVMLQSDNPNLRFDPVGAMDIGWNPGEWQSNKRGL